MMNKRKTAIYVTLAVVLLVLFNYPFMQVGAEWIGGKKGMETYTFIALVWLFTVLLLLIITVLLKSKKESLSAQDYE